ncbi:MAG: hypothetical protein AAGB51_09485 [Planctomycetota bacterium]
MERHQPSPVISGPGFDRDRDNSIRIGPAAPEYDLESQEDREAGARLAKRLLIAFVLIAVIWIVFVTVLASYVSPMMPMLISAVIGVGAFLAGAEDVNKPTPSRSSAADDHDCDGGCAVGMCGGPRPLGELSRRAREQRG